MASDSDQKLLPQEFRVSIAIAHFIQLYHFIQPTVISDSNACSCLTFLFVIAVCVVLSCSAIFRGSIHYYFALEVYISIVMVILYVVPIKILYLIWPLLKWSSETIINTGHYFSGEYTYQLISPWLCVSQILVIILIMSLYEYYVAPLRITSICETIDSIKYEKKDYPQEEDLDALAKQICQEFELTMYEKRYKREIKFKDSHSTIEKKVTEKNLTEKDSTSVTKTDTLVAKKHKSATESFLEEEDSNVAKEMETPSSGSNLTEINEAKEIENPSTESDFTEKENFVEENINVAKTEKLHTESILTQEDVAKEMEKLSTEENFAEKNFVEQNSNFIEGNTNVEKTENPPTKSILTEENTNVAKEMEEPSSGTNLTEDIDALKGIVKLPSGSNLTEGNNAANEIEKRSAESNFTESENIEEQKLSLIKENTNVTRKEKPTSNLTEKGNDCIGQKSNSTENEFTCGNCGVKNVIIPLTESNLTEKNTSEKESYLTEKERTLANTMENHL